MLELVSVLMFFDGVLLVKPVLAPIDELFNDVLPSDVLLNDVLLSDVLPIDARGDMDGFVFLRLRRLLKNLRRQ